MADRDREGVGGMARRRVRLQGEDRAHHPLDLCLLGAAVAADGLLHAGGRVLNALDAERRGGDEHCPARLTDGERGAGICSDERLFDCDGGGLVRRNQRLHPVEDRLEAELRALPGGRLPPPVVECPDAASAFLDDPVPASSRPWVDAENSHEERLGSPSDVPAVREAHRIDVSGYVADMDSAGMLVTDDVEHPLRDALSIGRDAGNDIVRDQTTVSRRHAMLLWSNGRWLIRDLGSANGTFVNGQRVPFDVPHPLRHGDRIGVGSETLLFSWPAEADDPERTDEHEALDTPQEPLTPFQRQLVRALCGAWVGNQSLDALPTNEQLAAFLGTPDAIGSVKAGLRRVYAKAGLSDLPPHAKRRELCRTARARGWL